MFVALTDNTKAQLTIWHKIPVAFAVICFGIAVLAGAGLAAASYTGVDGTSPEAVVTDVLSSAGAGSPTPYTINPPITTISNNGWLVSTGATATWTAHSGTNQRQTTPGPISAYLADSGPLSPAGSYTVTVDTNFNGGQNLASITAALKPAVAGGGSNRMLLGVGQ